MLIRHPVFGRFNELIHPLVGLQAVRFNDATSEIATGTGGTGLANLDDFTVLVWGRIDGAPSSQGYAYSHGSGNPKRLYVSLSSASRLIGFRDRTGGGSVDTTLIADFSAFAAYAANRWLLWVFRSTAAGAAELLVGGLELPAAPPSSYTTNTAGSGTGGNNSADDPTIGNKDASSNGWGGEIAVAAVVGHAMTDQAIIDWQFKPTMLPNLGGLWVPDTYGKRFLDISGHARHMVLSGGAQLAGRGMPVIAPRQFFLTEVASNQVTGTGSAALPFAGSGSGTVDVDGAGDVPLPIAGSGAGAVAVAGSGDAALPIVGAGTAIAEIQATGDAPLPFSGTGSGAVAVQADGAAALPMAGAGVGAVDVAAAGDAALPLVGAGAGAVDIDAVGDASLPIAGSGTGTVAGGITGTGDAALPLVGSGAGEVGIEAAGDAVLPLAGAGIGAVEVQGAGDAALPVAGSGTGTIGDAITGNGDASLPFAGSGAGLVAVLATGSASLGIAGAGTGTVAIAGAGTATLPFAPGASTGAVLVSAAGDAALPIAGLGTSSSAVATVAYVRVSLDASRTAVTLDASRTRLEATVL